MITVVQKDLYYVILTDRSINTKIPPIGGIKIEIGNVYKLELHPILVDGKIKDKDFPTSVSYLRISEHTELYLHNYNPKFVGYFTDNQNHEYYLRVGYLKMKVIDDLKKETINKVVGELTGNVTEMDTDDSTSYVNLKHFVPKHNAQVIPKEKVGEVLPWVHIAISNAKRQLINTFHDIKPEFLQNYLDEFCYKFNRRYFGEALFGRLLIACVSYKNEFRYKYG
ncbi:hypothetical protein FACS1894169_07500 [Bacteroidia bacterium]|nr:hypothetical protein FACS1894169_07500 [Bacteroidia bacterium]